jgi:surface protein
MFVTVSSNVNYGASSPDGITWTSRSLSSSFSYGSSNVVYGNGVFVSVGNYGGYVATSVDGITWATQRVLPNYLNWYSLTYGNGIFVALGYNSNVAATSVDGISWTQRTLPVGSLWYGITYGNGVFVALGYNSNTAVTSPDGITWTQRTLPFVDNWYSLAYGNGVFVALSINSNNALTSPDGITWTQRVLPVSDGWYAVTYGNGVFVAVANGGNTAISKDGILWNTISSSVLPAKPWSSIIYANGIFLLITSSESYICDIKGLYDTVIEVNWGNGNNYVYNGISPVPIKGIYNNTANIDSKIIITRRSGNAIINFSTLKGNTGTTGFAYGLRSIEKFGTNVKLADGGGHFYNCRNLTEISLTDAPINPSDNSYSQTFYNCNNFTGNGLINWNTANITNMNQTFYLNSVFAFDLYNWDLSKVNDMYQILISAAYTSTNYSKLLTKLAAAGVNTGSRRLGVSTNYINQASIIAARNTLIANGWTITDNGGAAS